MPKVLIVGGTGFLGYHTALIALQKGWEVGSLAIHDVDLEGWFPKEIKVYEKDVFTCTEDELIPIMQGYDYMVYSVGPDDRITPKAPSYEYFYDRLVVACSKVFRAAQRAGIKKATIFNSYFTYFNDIYPKLELEKYHPYVKVRIEQARLLNEQKKNMQVVILMLPYIFGSVPKRTPLWKDVFLDRFANGQKTIFFPKGSTTMIAVQHIGEAAIGALEYGKDGAYYPIGDENHTFKYMLDNMTQTILGKPRKVVSPAGWICALGAKFAVERPDKKKGLEPGLNYSRVMKDIMSNDIVIPPDVMDKVNAELHIGRGGLEEAIKETMLACYPDKSEFK